VTAAGLRDWLSLIRFSHTVFALPFALVALLVATGGRPPLALLAKVIAAAVLARTAAMAYNRFADRDLDARNPRTAGREIPRGAIAAHGALALALVAAAGFLAVAWWIAPMCLWLGLPVLAVLLGYSHAKRFTSLAHLWLGTTLGLAPPAAWVAATGRIDGGIVAACVLGLSVCLWVAGFDVLYACQDEEFDRREGLRSIPARCGRRTALALARAAHAGAAIGFLAFGVLASLGWPYFTAVGAVAVLLAIEHRLISPTDMSRVGQAFFTMNALVSLALLGGTIADLLLQ
jgi:4-hydroxybenzoate polyprenyltransferase